MDISPEGLREMFKQRAAADEELRQQEFSDLEDELEVIEAEEPKPARNVRKPKPELKNEPKPEPRPEARLDPRAEVKPRPEPWLEPRAEAKPKPEPWLEPRAEAKPKPEPWLEPRAEAKPKLEPRPAKPAESAASHKQSQTSQLEHSAAAFARIEASLRTIDKGLDLKLDEDRKAREARYDREGEEMRALGAQIESNVVSALESRFLSISKEQDRVAQLRQRALVTLGLLNIAAVIVVGALSIVLR